MWQLTPVDTLRNTMRKVLFLLFVNLSFVAHAQPLDSIMPVRGLSIAAPRPAGLANFLAFMEKELVPRQVNTLVLRVDFNYQYKNYPKMADEEALSQEQVKQLVNKARQHGLRLVPQINLLGHQSWAGTAHALLREFPEFDETPHVAMPLEYKWPNADGLYCKSYCPRHPDVHKVVFSLVDEIMDVFEADAFHAGMDEVFYIGDDKCPRCQGRDKAELFAEEVTRIRNHLAGSGRQLWIWGDRLLDGSTTGLGMWEGSMNNTHRAIDLIPKDVVICDWHYNRAEPTAAYFALKGFKVISCPWNKSQPAGQQVALMATLRSNSNPVLADRYYGIMHTVWSSAENFLDQFYGRTAQEDNGQVACFKAVFSSISDLAK